VLDGELGSLDEDLGSSETANLQGCRRGVGMEYANRATSGTIRDVPSFRDEDAARSLASWEHLRVGNGTGSRSVLRRVMRIRREYWMVPGVAVLARSVQ